MTQPQTVWSLWTTLPLAAGLAIDATVVAAGISVSLPAVTPRHAFRLAWHFGLSLALLHVDPWTVAPIIGLVTAALVLVGMKAGRVAGPLFGRFAEVVGGLVLIGIGVKILIEGLTTAAS